MTSQGAYALHICYAMSTSDDERIPLSYVSSFATATFCRTLRAYIDCPLPVQCLMATPREFLPLRDRAMPATGSPPRVHVHTTPTPDSVAYNALTLCGLL